MSKNGSRTGRYYCSRYDGLYCNSRYSYEDVLWRESPCDSGREEAFESADQAPAQCLVVRHPSPPSSDTMSNRRVISDPPPRLRLNTAWKNPHRPHDSTIPNPQSLHCLEGVFGNCPSIDPIRSELTSPNSTNRPPRFAEIFFFGLR